MTDDRKRLPETDSGKKPEHFGRPAERDGFKVFPCFGRNGFAGKINRDHFGFLL